MNVYSYIKAQNYQGFEVDIVRKILIQLMQALMFLHHVLIFNKHREISSTAISNRKMLSSNKLGSQVSNWSILVLLASMIVKSLPTSKVGIIDHLKLYSWNLMISKLMSGALAVSSSKYTQEPLFFHQEQRINKCKCYFQL